MKFMMIMYPGFAPGENYKPSKDDIDRMMKYNEDLLKAGVLLALDGLQPPSKGARIRFSGGKPSVTDGPFSEAKEVVGGYWMIQVRSREEAIAWACRCPAADREMIEVRQVFEPDDFDPGVLSPEARQAYGNLQEKK
jgi:hypothetical protein